MHLQSCWSSTSNLTRYSLICDSDKVRSKTMLGWSNLIVLSVMVLFSCHHCSCTSTLSLTSTAPAPSLSKHLHYHRITAVAETTLSQDLQCARPLLAQESTVARHPPRMHLHCPNPTNASEPPLSQDLHCASVVFNVSALPLL